MTRPRATRLVCVKITLNNIFEKPPQRFPKSEFNNLTHLPPSPAHAWMVNPLCRNWKCDPHTTVEQSRLGLINHRVMHDRTIPEALDLRIEALTVGPTHIQRSGV